MNQTVNLPIQLISSCSTVGDMIPLRFRYENEEHALQTVTISEVLSHKQDNRGGLSEIVYICSAVIEDRKTLFSLKYRILQHQWILFQILS